ncbi:MAG: DUF2865 domain-containing protein [Hyphomicrobiaceae bacterium]|nr:DUF2865 domain-containing protein [Hyphomicrobiaceae bacterium]
MQSVTGTGKSVGSGGARAAWAALAGLLAMAAAGPSVEAQGFKWPWETDNRPVPQAPVYRDRQQPPPAEQPPPIVRESGDGAWSARSPICVDLERRLVQESQRGGSFRDRLPQLEAELKVADQDTRKAERQLERADCYEYFLFTKNLRRSRQCVELSRVAEDARRRLASLEGERQALTAHGSQSYQDEIIRELARNNCGGNYVQEARRRDRGPLSPFWQDDESGTGPGGSGFGNNYKALPFATYRTLCVRLCDGYYFPVSFSTLPNHFERDAELCTSRCAAPVDLYYHQNPGEGVEQMLSATSNQPYAQLNTAFRYRKEYIDGCSCKAADFLPAGADQRGAAPGAVPPAQTQGRRAAADGWQADTRAPDPLVTAPSPN